MNGKAVLFDLDGTLTDPFEGITKCLQHALRSSGLSSPPPQAELAQYIGPPLTEAFRELLSTDDTDAIDRAVRSYRERFAELGMYENAVYAGVPEALADLFVEGYALYVATSKPVEFARRIVDHFQLHTLFRAVHGSELDGTLSDKAELIASIMQEHALNPQECIMVGDRRHDVVGAIACGVPVVGVLWGYGSQEELVGAGATVLCEHPEHLFGTINSLAGTGNTP
ncbi:MAG: HAD family hydrolase [Spirochaetaceae bacterium]|nr:MAG: HAD family hydrolase [Spirochaetaceae bacterium]